MTLTAAAGVPFCLTLTGRGASISGMIVLGGGVHILGPDNSLTNMWVNGSTVDGIMVTGDNAVLTRVVVTSGAENGLHLLGNHGTVTDSLFGITATEYEGHGNARSGMLIVGSMATIEGCVSSANVEGITVQGSNATVTDSKFGSTPDGLQAAGNLGRGAQIDGSDVIFQTCLLSGNMGDGARVFGPRFLLEDSTVGLDETRTVGLGTTFGVTLVFGARGSIIRRSVLGSCRATCVQLITEDVALLVWS